MQDPEQARVDDQGLRIADQFGHHLSRQGPQEAPELADAAVQRGRGEPDDPGEQVREQPLGVPQEGAFALNPTKLLEEGKRDDLRVGEPLYGLVAMGVGIEQRVSIVYEAEEGDDRLFRSVEASGMVLVGHPELLWSGVGRRALFLSQPTTQQTSTAYCDDIDPHTP